LTVPPAGRSPNTASGNFAGGGRESGGHARTVDAPEPVHPAAARLNLTSLIGAAGAVALLIYVAHRSSVTSGVLDPTGLVIVFGGTLVAALLAFRGSEIRTAIVTLGSIWHDDGGIERDVQDLLAVARLLHRHRVIEADARLKQVASPFLALGLRLCVDATPLDDLMQVMCWRVQKFGERELTQARLFRTLAAFAPAFGLVGTLTGLMGMMGRLGHADVSAVGSDMAVALLSTFYGLILANAVFKPIAIKLEQRTQRRMQSLNVLLEGIILLRIGRTPSTIAAAIEALAQPEEDEMGMTA
jgi:chemotaxis protein MotA